MLRKQRVLTTALVLMAVMCGMIIPASASTSIPGGDVSGTWSAAGSPYLIEGDIVVPAGQTLTIEPGVEIIFQS